MLSSPIVKRVLIGLVIVVIAVCGGIGVYGQIRRHHRESYLEQLRQDKIAARTPLQRTASEIEHARRIGAPAHFASVPKELPPGLILMEPVELPGDYGVIDVYSYGELKVFVRYSPDLREPPCGTETCVRATKVGFVTDQAPSLEYAAIWLTGKASSPEQEAGVKDFWAKTTWVPTARADWFNKLAMEGDVE